RRGLPARQQRRPRRGLESGAGSPRVRRGPKHSRWRRSDVLMTSVPMHKERHVNRIHRATALKGIAALVVAPLMAWAGPALARVDTDGRAIVDSAGAVAGVNPVATGTLRQNGHGSIHI